MSGDQLKKLENERMRRAEADLTLDKQILAKRPAEDPEPLLALPAHRARR